MNAVVACVTAACVLGGVHVLEVTAAEPPTIPVSGDVQKVPVRWDTVLMPVSEADMPHSAGGELKVTSSSAVRAAEAELRLTDYDVDPGAGVVRALLTDLGGSRELQQKMVWIVVANVDAMSQGPQASQHFITHKLCIVVDASTGAFLEAYAAGPRTFVGSASTKSSG